jgi:hypothetical protein
MVADSAGRRLLTVELCENMKEFILVSDHKQISLKKKHSKDEIQEKSFLLRLKDFFLKFLCLFEKFVCFFLQNILNFIQINVT